MADQSPRTETGVSSCFKTSTATAKNRTSSASTAIETNALPHFSHLSNTSMAIPTSSNSLTRFSLELEHNCDQRPWDSCSLRNGLTAVLEKIETRQYSKDKPLDFAEEIALDWKQVAHDDQEIARWLNGPPASSNRNKILHFQTRRTRCDYWFGAIICKWICICILFVWLAASGICQF